MHELGVHRDNLGAAFTTGSKQLGLAEVRKGRGTGQDEHAGHSRREVGAVFLMPENTAKKPAQILAESAPAGHPQICWTKPEQC